MKVLNLQQQQRNEYCLNDRRVCSIAQFTYTCWPSVTKKTNIIVICNIPDPLLHRGMCWFVNKTLFAHTILIQWFSICVHVSSYIDATRLHSWCPRQRKRGGGGETGEGQTSREEKEEVEEEEEESDSSSSSSSEEERRKRKRRKKRRKKKKHRSV